MDVESDSAVIRQALAGEPDDLPALVDRWTPVIQTRVVRVLKRRGYGWDQRTYQQIEEFVQQVFVSLFEGGCQALRAWHPERGLSLDNWVGLLAERQVLALVRTRKTNPWTEEPVVQDDLNGASAQPDPEHQTLSRDVLNRLLDRLQETLSPRGWQIFRLLYLEEQDVASAARLSGLTPTAIYAWRSRLRRLAVRLRDDLMSENRLPVHTPDQRAT